MPEKMSHCMSKVNMFDRMSEKDFERMPSNMSEVIKTTCHVRQIEKVKLNANRFVTYNIKQNARYNVRIYLM